MPFVTPALLRWLADRDGPAAVVHVNGCSQPLLGRYEPAVVDAFTRALAREQSLRSAAEAIGPQRLDERLLVRFGDPHLLCFNVNTTDDLASAEQMLAAM
jgi:molybdopterin-guanine dinucleotide biosynthesis protein A